MFVIVDGGIKFLGDFVKVIVVGVFCVMVGLMIVGMDEFSGEVIFYNGCLFKFYCGMGSFGVMVWGLVDCYF